MKLAGTVSAVEVLNRCEQASIYEDAGEYEAAREVLGELWMGLGYRPLTTGLQARVIGELLLRTGWLTNHLGSVSQICGSQESALNLLAEAQRTFAEIGERERELDAYRGMATSYWRVGAHDEGRAVIQTALPLVMPDSEAETKLLITLAIIAQSEQKFDEMLSLLEGRISVVSKHLNASLKGRFHHTLGLAFRGSGQPDNALEQYSTASSYYERAGHLRYKASIENNIGFVHYSLGRYGEAHRHLSIARELFLRLNNKGTNAQVDETRARVYIAEENYVEAEKAAREAVEVLLQGDEYALQVEALTTHAVALARLGEINESIQTFSRAHYIAADKIGSESSRQVGRAMVKELAGKLLFEAGVPFDDAVFELEQSLIKEALRLCNGNLTAAAFKLGIKHYQTLQKKLRTAHHELETERSPVIPRKRSIIVRKPQGSKNTGKNVAYMKDRNTTSD